MLEVIVLIIVAASGLVASACAINYFSNAGMRRALGYAAFLVAIFFVFWASGLWIDAERHSWGKLTPVFLLMLAAGALVVWVARKLWRNLRKSWQDKE